MRLQDIYDVRWSRVREQAFAYINLFGKAKDQGFAQERDLVTGVAVNFLLVCERFKLDPRRVLETADRITRRARDVSPQYVRGIEEYLAQELDG
ncbi:MAG: hypothetical protein HRU02_15820 [Myxococcales bacterium]|nr:hypothetical protein [Myxococcales bacterium]